MNCRERFLVEPGRQVTLADFDSSFSGKDDKKKDMLVQTEKLKQRMDALQFQLYAEQKRSLLICLQGLDAAGKDGVVRHVVGAMNPQGCRVVAFKQPSLEEAAHDFLWRIERETPRRGEVAIFNRSHYEDVLVVRVHKLVAKKVWSRRYEQINAFEERLAANGTHILKFFLHISKDEQLQRFKQRLDDPARQWKISETDYAERKFWTSYETAYADALGHCSTSDAPWFVIPSDRKWFRNFAVSQIIVETLESLNLKVPQPTVNIAEMRKKYHESVADG